MKFSLLVGSFNRPELLRETVDTLVANGGPAVEILIGDDASPRQAEIVAAMADRVAAGQVRLILHPSSLGWSRNRNSLVDAASGEWVILVGDDDHLVPGAVERLRAEIAADPATDLFGFGYEIMDLDGHRTRTRRCPRRTTYRLGEGDAWREILYFDAVPMWSHHPFTMCCRRTIAKALPYRREAGVADDVFFLFEVLCRGYRFTVLPDVLFRWRKVIKPVRGYLNLSSQGDRSAEGRRAVWLMMVREPGLPDEVRRMVESPRYIGRFLEVSPAVAASLSAAVPEFRSGARGAADPLLAPGLESQRGFFKRLSKTLRCVRVLGPGHLLQRVGHVRDVLQDRRRAG